MCVCTHACVCVHVCACNSAVSSCHQRTARKEALLVPAHADTLHLHSFHPHNEPRGNGRSEKAGNLHEATQQGRAEPQLACSRVSPRFHCPPPHPSASSWFPSPICPLRDTSVLPRWRQRRPLTGPGRGPWTWGDQPTRQSEQYPHEGQRFFDVLLCHSKFMNSVFYFIIYLCLF